MNAVPVDLDESAARVLALVLAADGDADETKTRVLDQLDAWHRIGVSRSRFLRLVHASHAQLGDKLRDSPWLPSRELFQLDRVLDNVTDPELRLMVCRLAASVITADGRVSEAERLVYDRTLARWHISSTMVTQAILADRLH